MAPTSSRATPPATSLSGFSVKRVLAVVVPLLLLGVIYWAAIAHRGFFRGEAQKRVTLTPEEANRLEEQSRAFLRQERYADALAPNQTLSQAYPDNPIYLGRLARIYGHLSNYRDEAAMWERFMNDSPTPLDACPRIGQTYWKLGEQFYPQAIAAYERCLKLDPKNADSYFFLAHALEMTGNFARAAQLYQQGLDIAPAYNDLRVGLSRCLLRLDKVPEARQEAQQVLAKDPNSRGALLAMGLIELHDNNLDKAKAYLQRGVKLADNDPDYHVLLARIAEKENDDAEAFRQYTRIVELRPDDQRARARRDALLAASKTTKK